MRASILDFLSGRAYPTPQEGAMPQISLYIDQQTLKKIESAAERQHISISRWVADQIRAKIEPIYPKGYEDLFGSITDESFIEPGEVAFSSDTQRESL
jgi:hypothetical protein